MCQVIAEIGWNHGGDMALAEQMIIEASRAGADFVKFQSWSVKNLKSGPWDTDGRRQIYRKNRTQHRPALAFDEDMFRLEHTVPYQCFFAKEDAEKIRIWNCESVKATSPEIASIPLLEYVLQNFDRPYLSTGAATYAEIKTAVEVLGVTRNRREPPAHRHHSVALRIRLPVPVNENQFAALCGSKKNSISRELGSDTAVTAKAFSTLLAQDFGIEVVEKHFTTDKNLPGRDNKFAILPHELKYLCDYISHRWDMGASPFTEYDVAEEEVRNGDGGKVSFVVRARDEEQFVGFAIQSILDRFGSKTHRSCRQQVQGRDARSGVFPPRFYNVSPKHTEKRLQPQPFFEYGYRKMRCSIISILSAHCPNRVRPP
jgi:sialic acid synthase SpsE